MDAGRGPEPRLWRGNPRSDVGDAEAVRGTPNPPIRLYLRVPGGGEVGGGAVPPRVRHGDREGGSRLHRRSARARPVVVALGRGAGAARAQPRSDAGGFGGERVPVVAPVGVLGFPGSRRRAGGGVPRRHRVAPVRRRRSPRRSGRRSHRGNNRRQIRVCLHGGERADGSINGGFIKRGATKDD